MTTNKSKKDTKYRASTTHGGGHRKKRRGAGNRGGRGKAGSGKRGKAKKQASIKLGRKGFTSIHQTKKSKTLCLSQLQTFIETKKIPEKDGLVNLTSLGYQKLLSQGDLSQPLKIMIVSFSQKAEEKVKAAGGEIIPPSKKINKTEEKSEKKEKLKLDEE